MANSKNPKATVHQRPGVATEDSNSHLQQLVSPTSPQHSHTLTTAQGSAAYKIFCHASESEASRETPGALLTDLGILLIVCTIRPVALCNQAPAD